MSERKVVDQCLSGMGNVSAQIIKNNMGDGSFTWDVDLFVCDVDALASDTISIPCEDRSKALCLFDALKNADGAKHA